MIKLLRLGVSRKTCMESVNKMKKNMKKEQKQKNIEELEKNIGR